MKWKSVDVPSLNHDIAMSELCTNPPNDLDELVACYNNTLKAHFDKYAPPKTKTITVRARVPWFNEQLRKAKRERWNAERKWRVSKSDVDFVNFKGKRNLVNRLMCKARTEYYTSFIEENSGDQKKLFNASKRLFGQHHDDGLSPNLNCEAFVSDIGKYFVQKIGNIRRKLDNNKCDALFPIITRIINLSLQTGQFPQLWKEAHVHPLLKKLGLEAIFKNFRPISNLPFVSKLAERAVFEQMHVHMVDHDLYPPGQSSYRKNHSNETALLKVKNDLLMNMNKQHVSLLVFLDMSAAFDTVDHGIMIERLSSKLGFSGTVISWFQSYLCRGSQRVTVHGTVSDRFDVAYGVPQGSCLGPLLFTIYVSKLFDIVQRHLPDVHCYADDSQLYVAFRPKVESEQSDAVTAMERCIEDIRKWMSEDKLLLNDEKTEFLLIGTKQQLAKVNLDHITVGTTDIAPQPVAKNLGHSIPQVI
ncbi:Hypothetical predicted protein [Paramuricea clavata]|uniref:Uncharacterized protein n=1 Tax=Paramuricea clavata TaxID=317549 RepID=A0A6S7FSG5_PARCT|nr:Hypothetical predicted protein [Paramuricea clavata]